MKTVFILFLLMTSLAHAVTAVEKRNFIARTMYPEGGSWPIALRIESNFKVPFFGSQPYFGKIYFKKGEDHILYRDELLATSNFKQEFAHPSIYRISSFKFAEMNAPNGSDVATGVRLIGKNINGNTGGRLTISVKAPGTSRTNIPMEVHVKGNRAVVFAKVDNQSFEFNMIRINAHGESILAGVDNVEFFLNGRHIHTLYNNE